MGKMQAISRAEKRELDARLQAYQTDRDPGSSWDQVKTRLRQKLSQTFRSSGPQRPHRP